MKTSIKVLGAVALLATMIPLSAFAASSSDASTTKETKLGKPISHEASKQRGMISDEVLTLLKLDQKTLGEKLSQGQTLAQIAEAQGVSRDVLKNQMTTSYNNKIEQQKKNYADKLDKMLDSTEDQKERSHKGMRFNSKLDSSQTASLLGMSTDDLKKALVSGKSLAQLAADKGVDVQKLIDLQLKSITEKIDKQLTEGKITQEQATESKAKAVEQITKAINSTNSAPALHKKHKEDSNTSKTDGNMK